MRRKPATQRARLTALGLELAGACGLLAAVAHWSPWAALALGGLLLVLCAQFLEEML